MKAYGIPRVDAVEHPDKADIKRYGLATTDRCSKADRGKNKVRRYWKKRARRQGKTDIRKELDNGTTNE